MRKWYKIAAAKIANLPVYIYPLGLIIGLYFLPFILLAGSEWAFPTPIMTVSAYPSITDITCIRLYDKLFIRSFLLEHPNDIMQLYTNFLYDYRFDLFRHGFYDDVFGWVSAELTRVSNYDLGFLAWNRFDVKTLVAVGMEVLDPAPYCYFYRTYYLVGYEFGTGIPFKLGIHDGEVWGSFVQNAEGVWQLYSGRDPFVDGLRFSYIPIGGGWRILDLLYYVDSPSDTYFGPLSLNERIRVFALRCDSLEWTPSNPVVSIPPAPVL